MQYRAMLMLVVLAAGCREAPAPFSIADPFEGDSTGRLTFNLKSDHTPTWNKAGDSIYYTAESYPGFPTTRGVLVGVPHKGGTARLILEPVQTGVVTQPWLSAPVPSPDGKSIAFFQLTDVRDREFDHVSCSAPPGSGLDTVGTGSILQAAVLRARSINSTAAGDAGSIPVTFVGRTIDPNTLDIINVAHPFQRLFEAEGVPIFRPSWSPDGTRVVFSDGSRLRLWTVGQATSTPIAGTDDGIMPAWSPDGNWIAFSKPFRGAEQRFTCSGYMNGQVLPAATFRRTSYSPVTRENAQLMLVRPDGTGLRSLGTGDGPAWTPDSKTVVAHRDDNLYRVPIEGGAPTLIPNTVRGFEPAVSPDGRSIAFAKRRDTEIGGGQPVNKGYNIWVVAF